MYQDHLLRLARHSPFRRALAPEQRRCTRRNPACGDELSFAFHLEGGRLTGLGFDGQGCALCLASAAAACEALEGTLLPEARQRVDAALDYFAASGDWTHAWNRETFVALGAARAFPMRMACIRLAWDALNEHLSTDCE